ncbi:MAG: hypothetical protein VW806_01510 [Halieaceae bacterium]|jgi:hypothetical protein
MKLKLLAGFLSLGTLLSLAVSAQEYDHHGHNSAETAQQDHSAHTDHAGHDHGEIADAADDAMATVRDSDSHVTLTLTENISAALAEGGEPIVADVMGVVCDFCALAMNKIFSKREEVAAMYVDLDTKALSLVLAPGATMSDETIADLAVQAGYRIAAVRRGDEALGQTS